MLKILFKNTLIFTSLSIFILSCSGPKFIEYANNLIYLEQGMKYSVLDSMFNFKYTAYYTKFDIELENQKYYIVRTRIYNYEKREKKASGTTETSLRNPSAPYSAPQKIESTRFETNISDEKDYFYLLFKDLTLVKWGYIYEFRNSESEYENKIGDLLLKNLK